MLRNYLVASSCPQVLTYLLPCYVAIYVAILYIKYVTVIRTPTTGLVSSGQTAILAQGRYRFGYPKVQGDWCIIIILGA